MPLTKRQKPDEHLVTAHFPLTHFAVPVAAHLGLSLEEQESPDLARVHTGVGVALEEDLVDAGFVGVALEETLVDAGFVGVGVLIRVVVLCPLTCFHAQPRSATPFEIF